MIRFSFITIGILLFSCSTENNQNKSEDKKEKDEVKASPKEFAIEYCDCLSNENSETNCDSILTEFETNYGSQNKDAEIEFSKEMQNCL